MYSNTNATKMTQKIEEMPGYDDIFEKILEELPPEKRLLGLTAEQREPRTRDGSRRSRAPASGSTRRR